MSMQFILGRAGSGKTTYILESIKNELIKNPTKRIILLVPEQATAMNEHYIANSHELKGTLSLQILSFQRLAWMILQEVGGITRLPVNDLGKRMLLRKIINDYEKELVLLGRGKHKPGFIDSIAQLISEMKKYQIDMKQVDRVVTEQKENESFFASKLTEIGLIYQQYNRYLEGEFLDTDDYLTLLQEKISLSDQLKETEIWIDEFHGFTPQQIGILSELLTICPKVYISLTLNSLGDLNTQPPIFNTTMTTYQQIKSLGETLQLTIVNPILLKDTQRFISAPSLEYLEQNFFQWNAKPYIEQVEDIRILSVPNYRSEIEFIAQEIIHLCRDEGYRFSDIGLLVRDIANYQLLLETMLNDYEIPYFVDIKQKVQHHSLVELIKAALEVVQSNWSYASVFRYLKTDLTPLNREEIDSLENYVLSYGIKGAMWYKQEDWTYHQHSGLNNKEQVERCGNETINIIRDKVVSPLLKFYKQIKRSDKAVEYNQAVYQLLEQLHVPLTLKRWADIAIEEGELEKGQEYNQIWNDVIDVIDQIIVVLGEEALSLQDYMKIMETGLESINLGLIPPSLDQVTIASLDRSRISQLKVGFIIGLNEGSFPAKPINEGLLTDSEREILKEKGILLAPTIKEKLFEEEFLIYTALTRCSEKLYLLHAQGDNSGKGLRPSIIIRRVKELFPTVNLEQVGIDNQGQGEQATVYLSHPRKALGKLGKELYGVTEGFPLGNLWQEVYSWLWNNQYRNEIESIITALEHGTVSESLSDILAKDLYGNPFRTSVSSLEMYYRCPFSHFLTKGLRLEERKIYKLASLDLGQFYHKAMEDFTNKLVVENQDISLLTDQEIKEEVAKVVDDLVPKLQNEILLSSGKNRYLTKRLKITMEKTALIMAEHARRGVFKLQGVEVYFGPDGEIPSLVVNLKDGTKMELVGRIDRVEQCNQGDRCYFRIIDFKSGKAGLDLLEVFYGLKLQLLAYLEVIERYYQQLDNAKQNIPAGVLYFYFKDPIINAKMPLSKIEIEKKLMDEFMPQGLVLADIQILQLSDCFFGKEASQILPASLKKDGKKLLDDPAKLSEIECQKELFTKSSSVVTLEEMSVLKEHISQTIAQAGNKILQGDIKVFPCKLKDKEGCIFCQYQAVCQFDESLSGNQYRMLATLETDQLWEMIEKKRKEDQDGNMDNGTTESN